MRPRLCITLHSKFSCVTNLAPLKEDILQLSFLASMGTHYRISIVEHHCFKWLLPLYFIKL